MNIKQTLFIFVLLLIILCGSAYGAESGTVGENYTVWADIYEGAEYYDATNASITIYDEDQALLYDNVTMQEFATGIFFFIFTPNSTGQHYVSVQYYNDTGLVATASDSFTIKDDNMNFLALVLGFIGISFILLYTSFQVKTEIVPKGRIVEKIALYGAGLMSVAVIVFLLIVQSTENEVLAPYFNFLSQYFLVMLLIVALIFGFFAFYILRLVYKPLGTGGDK